MPNETKGSDHDSRVTKTYLGDAVYVDHDSNFGGIVLTTEDGMRATNTIVFEPVVLAALLQWLRENDHVR